MLYIFHSVNENDAQMFWGGGGFVCFFNLTIREILCSNFFVLFFLLLGGKGRYISTDGEKVFDFVGSLLVTASHTDVVGTLKMSVGVSRDCTERERESCVKEMRKQDQWCMGWMASPFCSLTFFFFWGGWGGGVCFLTSLMVMCVCRCSKKITLKESIQWNRTIVPYVTQTTVFPSEEEKKCTN